MDRQLWSCVCVSVGVASSETRCHELSLPCSLQMVAQIKLPCRGKPGPEQTSQNSRLSFLRAFEAITALCKRPLKPPLDRPRLQVNCCSGVSSAAGQQSLPQQRRRFLQYAPL